VQRTLRTGQTVTVVMILQTVQCGVQSTERELLGLTDCKCGGERVERGVFSVLCAVSKMRFGTIDCDVAHCYSEQTERFEQNSESVTVRLKQQFCVVKLC